MEYLSGPDRNGKPAWKDIWITMTINSLNYGTIDNLIQEWKGGCPSWAILSLDHMGREKKPCCIGSADSNH
jgi:hypothetical protein